MAFALGEMGMRDADLWDLTPYELHRRLVGWRRRQEARRLLVVYGSWNTAAFSRAKRMPPLERVLKPAKTRRLRGKEAKRMQDDFEAAAQRAGVSVYTGAPITALEARRVV